MYTREQLSRYRTAFWTSFGQYMKPVDGAGGTPLHWINYKTGIRHIYFKMDADLHSASISIQLRHPDTAGRIRHYEQLLALKQLLENETTAGWYWQAHTVDEHGTSMASISQQLQPVSIANQSDWPAIISFLKQNIIGLDAFWEMVKDGFE